MTNEELLELETAVQERLSATHRCTVGYQPKNATIQITITDANGGEYFGQVAREHYQDSPLDVSETLINVMLRSPGKLITMRR